MDFNVPHSLLFTVVVLAELQLMSRRQNSLVRSTSTISQPFSLGSSLGLDVTQMGCRGGRSAVTDSSEAQGQHPSATSLSLSQQQALQSSKATVLAPFAPTPICCFQESVSPQATLIYRELYVLPFQFYDKLRKVVWLLTDLLTTA